VPQLSDADLLGGLGALGKAPSNPACLKGVRGFSNQWSWNGPGVVVGGGISMKPQEA
jgi:hypothetical protein